MTAPRAILACTFALAMGLHAIAAEADAPIQLPPMIVSDSNWTKPWRYATGAGMEVLSHCDDDTTRALIERTDRLNQLLGYMLPPELEFHPTGPRLTILVDAAMAPSLSQNLVTAFGRRARSQAPTLVDGPPRLANVARAQVSMLPNLQLEDVDVMAVFAIVDERNFDSDGVAFAPDYVGQLLQHRTPPLPAWFIAGFMSLFHQLSFGTTDVRIGPLLWPFFSEREQLKNDPDAPRQLMPMQDFFGFSLRSASAEERRRWLAQAALLVHWTLDPAAPERRVALWRFVEGAAEQGESEALLRRCFQLGYSDLRDRLSDYLPQAIDTPLDLRPPNLTRAPKVRLRDATPAEVARMKGEWERLEVAFVQRRYAAFAPQYAELARQTLTTGLQHAPNDAGILAARGLLESDLNDAKAARPFLEAAVASGAVRPRVYVELAKFRLDDALASTDQGPLSVGKAEVVLEPLQRALAEPPPVAEVYALAAEVWARSGALLSDKQWRLLLDGIKRFPDNPRLLAYSAELKATSGDFTTALDWIDRAIALSGASPEAEAPLLKLRESIVRSRDERQSTGAASPVRAMAVPPGQR